MLRSQYEMWMHVFQEYIVFMEEEGRDMSSEFRHGTLLLKGTFANCTDVKTFELRCTAANLKYLCDLTEIVVGNGSANAHFPQWTYLVTQFQLFVLEVQRKAQSKSEMAEEDLHTRGSSKRTRLAPGGLRCLLTQLKAL